MKHFFGELSSLLFIEKNEPCMEYFFSPFSPKYVWCVRKGVWCWCLSNYYRRYFELDKGCSGPSLSLPCLIVSLLPPELIPKAKYQHLDPWSSIRLNDVACAAVLVYFCEWHRIRVWVMKPLLCASVVFLLLFILEVHLNYVVNSS
jgi:hypothetical protein